VKLKPEKNSGLNGIGTQGLCETGVVLSFVIGQSDNTLVFGFNDTQLKTAI